MGEGKKRQQLEYTENSATVREEWKSAQEGDGNMNIEQAIEGMQEEVKVDENEKVSIIYSYDISVSILVKRRFFYPFV